MRGFCLVACAVAILSAPAAFCAAQGGPGTQVAPPPAWDPWRDLWDMQAKLNRIVEEAYGRFGMRGPAAPGIGAVSFYPEVDVSENDKEVVVRIDLPGMDKDKINVSFSDGNLVVTGTREVVKEEHKSVGWFMQERSFGSFERVIPIYPKIKEGEITAEYKNGVLTVRLPKAEEAVKPAKTIKII